MTQDDDLFRGLPGPSSSKEEGEDVAPQRTPPDGPEGTPETAGNSEEPAAEAASEEASDDLSREEQDAPLDLTEAEEGTAEPEEEAERADQQEGTGIIDPLENEAPLLFDRDKDEPVHLDDEDTPIPIPTDLDAPWGEAPAADEEEARRAQAGGDGMEGDEEVQSEGDAPSFPSPPLEEGAVADAGVHEDKVPGPRTDPAEKGGTETEEDDEEEGDDLLVDPTAFGEDEVEEGAHPAARFEPSSAAKPTHPEPPEGKGAPEGTTDFEARPEVRQETRARNPVYFPTPEARIIEQLEWPKIGTVLAEHMDDKGADLAHAVIRDIRAREGKDVEDEGGETDHSENVDDAETPMGGREGAGAAGGLRISGLARLRGLDTRLVTAVKASMIGLLALGVLVMALMQGGGVRSAYYINLSVEVPGANQVSVVGDFNDWDPEANPMTQIPGGSTWEEWVEVRPGRYRYAFLVDESRHMYDPRRGIRMEQTEEGNRVSVLYIPRGGAIPEQVGQRNTTHPREN